MVQTFSIPSDSQVFTFMANQGKHVVLHGWTATVPGGTREGFAKVKIGPPLTTISEIEIPAGFSVVGQTFDPGLEGNTNGPLYIWVAGCGGGTLTVEFERV